MPELVPGSFSVDHLGIYPGLVRADAAAEGPVYPLFTFDTAVAIMADWITFEGMPDEPPAEGLYDSNRDAFLLYEPATNEWHELVGERYGTNTLYAMGRDLWTWNRAQSSP